jgi:hypothetical protein
MKRLGVLVLGAIFIVSCGEGEPLTKEQFIRKADRICERHHEVRDDANTKLQTALAGSDFDEAVKQGNRAIDTVEEQQSELRDLTPPQRDQETIDQLFDQVDRAIDKAGQVIDALEERDVTKATVIGEETEALNVKSRATAQSYGFQVCGTSPPS